MLLSSVKRSGKNLFLSFKNSGQIFDKLMLEILMRSVCLHMIFLLLTILYLIICLQINVLIQLKELSIVKAFLTLHVATDTHFLLQKGLKNIMHDIVNMYVMR